MDVNYTHEVHDVPLQLQGLYQMLPAEWVVQVDKQPYNEFCVRLTRLVAELDQEKVDVEYEYVPYRYTVVIPKEPIDYLRVWLSNTFPLLTAPLFLPRYRTELKDGLTTHPVKHIYTTKKVVAAPGTNRFRYYVHEHF